MQGSNFVKILSNDDYILIAINSNKNKGVCLFTK